MYCFVCLLTFKSGFMAWGSGFRSQEVGYQSFFNNQAIDLWLHRMGKKMHNTIGTPPCTFIQPWVNVNFLPFPAPSSPFQAFRGISRHFPAMLSHLKPLKPCPAISSHAQPFHAFSAMYIHLQQFSSISSYLEPVAALCCHYQPLSRNFQ